MIPNPIFHLKLISYTTRVNQNSGRNKLVRLEQKPEALHYFIFSKVDDTCMAPMDISTEVLQLCALQYSTRRSGRTERPVKCTKPKMYNSFIVLTEVTTPAAI